VAEGVRAFRRDLNVVLSRGVWRVFAVTLNEYQRTLEGHALLDFSGVLERAVKLLKDMDEFAQSRFRSRRDIAMFSWTSSGHQPRAVAAGCAAGSQLG
jgi:hypothetical protein